MYKAYLSFLVFALVLFAACQSEKKTMPSVMFGQAEEEESSADYDLTDIQSAGELIAVTLSGPETYYEYRGQGFGLQYMMAEAFARSVGARLRMEIVNDSAELLNHLLAGEADLVALEIDSTQLAALMSSHDEGDGRPSLLPVRSQWVVRSNSTALAEAIDAWWKDDMRSRFLAMEKAQTTKAQQRRVQVRPAMLNRQKGIISPYDELLIRYAAHIGWDWRLLAAQCYQESGFDPHAVSWAGAQGLMQIMPSTAASLGLPRSEVFNPERNIEAAVRYLFLLDEAFSDIHSRQERINFVLAAYNGGSGHVRDAMALARKDGHNAQRWTDVDPYILKLSHPQYYRDPVVKYGYLRGSETSGYVRQIQSRWASYRGSAPSHHSSMSPISKGENPSRVRPRSEFITDSLLIQ